MYNRTKWLGDTADLGIQMSPIRGNEHYFSACARATLRKKGGELEIILWVRGRCPTPCSIEYFHPNLRTSVEPTMCYFYSNIPH
jgi:hypothetical protein